jgi:hypothetical protein
VSSICRITAKAKVLLFIGVDNILTQRELGCGCRPKIFELALAVPGFVIAPPGRFYCSQRPLILAITQGRLTKVALESRACAYFASIVCPHHVLLGREHDSQGIMPQHETRTPEWEFSTSFDVVENYVRDKNQEKGNTLVTMACSNFLQIFYDKKLQSQGENAMQSYNTPGIT